MPKVRGNGKLRKLGKTDGLTRYQMRVAIGRDPVTNKYITKTKVVRCKTKQEADEKLREFVRHIESGLATGSEVPTFAEFAKEWHERRRASKELSIGQLRKEELHIRTLKNYLGNINLQELNPRLIDNMFVKLRNNGSLLQKSLSGTTCNGMFITLKQILHEAFVYELIPNNPCDKLKAPKRDTKEKRALTPEELSRANAALEQMPFDAHVIAVALAMNTGMRRGEVLGLTWEDVDYSVGVIHVRHSLSSDGMTLKEPKTQSGKRTVPVDARFLAKLRRWEAVQESRLAELRLKPTVNTPVVTSETGGFMHPENLNRWWRKHRAELGLGNFTLHQFRHTYASVLVGEGADPKSVQSLIGHSDAAFTMKLYTHHNIENERRATLKIAGVIYGDGETVEARPDERGTISTSEFATV